jgi:hypothetical protein
LCDAVTGREGSQALLEEAEHAGLFLIPLDEVHATAKAQDRGDGLIETGALRALPPPPAMRDARRSVWIEVAYRDQEQPEVAHLGQQPVQGGLIGDWAADDGFLLVAARGRP